MNNRSNYSIANLLLGTHWVAITTFCFYKWSTLPFIVPPNYNLLWWLISGWFFLGCTNGNWTAIFTGNTRYATSCGIIVGVFFLFLWFRNLFA